VRGAVPEPGDTVSHGTFADAVKSTVPPPVLVTVKAFVSTVGAPATALNDNTEGATASWGGCGGGSTVKVTGTERGEPPAPAAATVIVAVWVPAARPAIDAETVTSRPPVPLPGATLSHAASSETVQLRVPPPLLLIASVRSAGLAPPCVPPKARLPGVTASAGPGGGGSTMSVTGIVRGEPVAPAAPTVTLAVYVPGARPVVSGVTVTVPAPVPPAGATLSHGASSDAVQSSVPAPVLATSSVLAAGFVPLKDRVAGVTDSDGAPGTPAQLIARAMSAPTSAAVSARSYTRTSSIRPVKNSGQTLLPPIRSAPPLTVMLPNASSLATCVPFA
jgi:hypothetical protein